MRRSVSALCGIALALAALAVAPSSHALPPRPPDPDELALRARRFVPAKPSAARAERRARHLLIQFEAGHRAEALAALRAQGVRVLEAVPRNAVSAWVPAGVDVAAAPGVRWAGPLQPADKLSLASARYARRMRVLVDVFPDVSPAAARDAVERAGGTLVRNDYLPATTLFVELAASAVASLTAQDEVSFVYPASDAIERNLPVHVCLGALTQGLLTPNYAIAAEGWDGPGQGSAALQYFFRNGTLDVLNEQSEVIRALQTWSQYAAITWSPAAAAAQARSVDFLWATGAHGDANPFDGPFGTLAHTFLPSPPNPEPLAGDVHFDDDEVWRVGADVDVYTVALHEIGHALGLDHSSDPSSVMYAYYSGPVQGLTADDVAAIRAIYQQVGPSVGDRYEPDDDASHAVPLTPIASHTIAPATDVDFYKFTLPHAAEVWLSIGLSVPTDDTFMTLLDDTGTVIETNDDASPGVKFSAIERSLAKGNPLPAGTYFVSVEETGRDAEVDGYNVSFGSVELPRPDGYEPDDSLAQALPMAAWTYTTHSISPIGDRDAIAFTIPALSEVAITTYSWSRYVADTELWLYASDGTLLDHDDDTPSGPLAEIRRMRAGSRWLQPGTYYAVAGESGGDAEIDTYNITVSVSPVPYGGDDAFEPNDTPGQAWSLTGTTSYFSSAYQWDDDYYGLDVPRGQNDLRISCWHLDPSVSFHLDLLDAAGTTLATSASKPTALEDLAVVVPRAGHYTLRAYGQNSGEGYRCSIDMLGAQPTEPPANDAFAARLPLSGANVVTLGDNFLATKEPGEPAHAGDAGGASVWWSWSAPSDGDVEISTGAQWDTVLAVYTGARVDDLTLVAENDNAGGSLMSGVSFRARGGESYAIAVDGHGGAEGAVSVRVDEPSAAPPPPPPQGFLRVSWSSLAAKCKATTRTCRLKAKLAVQNLGSVAVPAGTPIAITLSDDAVRDSTDSTIGYAYAPLLRPNATKKAKAKLSTSPGTVLIGRFVIAEWNGDGNGTLMNNQTATGPIR